MYLVGTKVRRGVQHAVGHNEAVVNVHHRVRRQMPNPIVLALPETLHAGKKLVLGHERVQSHGRGMIMRGTHARVVEGIDVVDFPLRPVKVMGDWIQVVEFLGDDWPSRVTVERF